MAFYFKKNVLTHKLSFQTWYSVTLPKILLPVRVQNYGVSIDAV